MNSNSRFLRFDGQRPRFEPVTVAGDPAGGQRLRPVPDLEYRARTRTNTETMNLDRAWHDRAPFPPGSPPDLPARPGVYQFEDALGTPIYVGKSVNLKRRVRGYF